MTLPARIARSAEAMASRVGDETVILHLGSGTYFGLDPVGTRIWELLESPQSPEAMHARLLTEFEVTAEILWVDICAFLDKLFAHGIIAQA